MHCERQAQMLPLPQRSWQKHHSTKNVAVAKITTINLTEHVSDGIHGVSIIGVILWHL
jgi:hypothetical protein